MKHLLNGVAFAAALAIAAPVWAQSAPMTPSGTPAPAAKVMKPHHEPAAAKPMHHRMMRHHMVRGHMRKGAMAAGNRTTEELNREELARIQAGNSQPPPPPPPSMQGPRPSPAH